MRARTICAAILLLTPLVGWSQAQGAIDPFAGRAIRSVEDAEAALSAATAARVQQERRYDLELEKCHQKFWADPCLVSARNNHSDQLDRIRAVEVQAGVFKRHDAARQADERLASRQAKDAEQSQQRRLDREEAVRRQQSKVERNEAEQRDFERGAAEREKRALEEHKRIAARVDARKKKEAEDAASRRERALAHEAKVAEITRRAKEKEAAAAAKESK